MTKINNSTSFPPFLATCFLKLALQLKHFGIRIFMSWENVSGSTFFHIINVPHFSGTFFGIGFQKSKKKHTPLPFFPRRRKNRKPFNHHLHLRHFPGNLCREAAVACSRPLTLRSAIPGTFCRTGRLGSEESFFHLVFLLIWKILKNPLKWWVKMEIYPCMKAQKITLYKQIQVQCQNMLLNRNPGMIHRGTVVGNASVNREIYPLRPTGKLLFAMAKTWQRLTRKSTFLDNTVEGSIEWTSVGKTSHIFWGRGPKKFTGPKICWSKKKRGSRKKTGNPGAEKIKSGNKAFMANTFPPTIMVQWKMDPWENTSYLSAIFSLPHGLFEGRKKKSHKKSPTLVFFFCVSFRLSKISKLMCQAFLVNKIYHTLDQLFSIGSPGQGDEGPQLLLDKASFLLSHRVY